jgi:prophage antirepressor-like protein
MSENRAPKSGANNQIVSFYFESHNIRVVERDGGDVWFVVKDLCDVLDIQNTTQAIESLDDDEKTILTSSQFANLSTKDVREMSNRGLNIISESGLYSIIFQSRKPEAKKFRKWVTSEVLPTIRKSGYYSVNSAREALAISDQRPPSLAELGCTNVKYRIQEFVNECIVEKSGHNLYVGEVYWAYQWWCVRKNYRYESKKDFLYHCVWFIPHDFSYGKDKVFLDVDFSNSKLIKAPYKSKEFKAYWRQENE